MTQVNTDYPGGGPVPSDVPFSALNFTASSGLWTVQSADVATNRLYALGNKCYQWVFRINTTTVSATPVSLIIALPNGLVAAKTSYQPFLANPTSLPTEGGIAEILSGQNTVQLGRYSGTWVTGTDLTYVSGVLFFEATT